MNIIYTQPDNMGSTEDQFLEIKTEDNGNGFYLVLKTDRWSFDNTNELIRILKDFQAKCGMTNKEV